MHTKKDPQLESTLLNAPTEIRKAIYAHVLPI